MQIPEWLSFRSYLISPSTVGSEYGGSADLPLEIADHIADTLACLHWLRVRERVAHKMAVLTYKVLHGTAPRYAGPLVPVGDLPDRRT